MSIRFDCGAADAACDIIMYRIVQAKAKAILMIEPLTKKQCWYGDMTSNCPAIAIDACSPQYTVPCLSMPVTSRCTTPSAGASSASLLVLIAAVCEAH